MDEEVGVRITRLRRRLSVEQTDEVASSPAPATPTKKRASKLPKPQLDNIVENAVVDLPKRTTRRSMAPEPTEGDKVSTPGTRVARVRSNTSLLEAPVAESPRAKRATRRGSFAESDTETVNTPVRRSRRISKDFNKSPETPVDQKLPPKITMKGSAAKVDVIEEEGDKEDKTSVTSTPSEVSKSADETSQLPTIKASKEPNNLVPVSEEASVSDKSSPSSVRKSPRLSLKKNNSISEELSEKKPAESKIVNVDVREEKSKLPKNLSNSEANKSLPVIGSKNVSGNKKRSKSFTKFAEESKEDGQLYYSDNERRTSKLQKKINSEPFMMESNEIGDHGNNKSINTSKSIITLPEIYENKENEINIENGNTSKIQVNSKILSDKKGRKSSTNISGINKLDITTDLTHISSSEKNYEVDSKQSKKDSISILQSGSAIEEDEGVQISSTIFMEDSDVNIQTSDVKPSKSKKNNSAQNVVNVFEGGKNNMNNTCEPMDVDETIPEIYTITDVKIPSRNTTLHDLNSSKIKKNESTSEKNNSIINISKSDQRNVSTKGNYSYYKDNVAKESSDKYNELEGTNNNSKSTLILSLNNIDKSSEENTNKRSRKFSNNDDVKSFDLNMNKELLEKKDLSANGSIGVTPIRNKLLQNVGVVTSTPVTAQDNQSKEQSIEDNLKKKKLLKQEPIDDEDIENSLDDNNSLLDDEAEEADGYESGDSLDESEREYAEQNEVPVRGETLDSDEDDESEDSEYEKDSFLVSTDEEDEELLSGSGDDLSMSNKELKMTSKSKKKYDERKMKEQKQASREMFEARHGKKKAISDNDSDDPDIIMRKKNNQRNRQRLDSSKDLSGAKICEEEPEMSIISNKSITKDPLNISVKKEIMDTTTANNTVLEEMENVTIDQDATIFSNKDTKNPLNDIEMSDSESSESNGGIVDSYDSLLKDLNDNSKKGDRKDTSINIYNKKVDRNSDISLKKTSNKEADEDRVTESKFKVKDRKPKKDLSFSEYKRSNNKKDNSILDKLNLTASGKEKKSKKTVLVQPTDDNSQPESTDINVMDVSISNISKEGKDQCLTKKKKSVDHELSHAVDVTDSKEKYKNLSFTEHKASKAKKDNSIVDKLNLTESGKQKKSNTINKENVNKTEATSVQINQDDSSSDSIDFKLLFAQDEDSNDTPNNDNQTNVDNFIPLKKSEAKINLLENKNRQNEIDVTSATNGDLTDLVKKSKKNKHKPVEDECEEMETVQPVEKPKRKRHRHSDEEAKPSSNEVADKLHQGLLESSQETSRKRKERAYDIPINSNKVFMTGTENKRKIQRLPAGIIEKLDDRPPKIHKKTARVTSTSNFEVQTIASKRQKPSAYLEESVHIDATPPRSEEATKVKKQLKILPYLPSASTSTVGFTSNFKVNILKREKRHDAKLAGPELVNFKLERMYGSNIKRIATEELCRKHKKLRITKF